MFKTILFISFFSLLVSSCSKNCYHCQYKYGGKGDTICAGDLSYFSEKSGCEQDGHTWVKE